MASLIGCSKRADVPFANPLRIAYPFPIVRIIVFSYTEIRMPQVQIADKTLARLQKHAVALVDTVDTVINRIVDAYENCNGHDHIVAASGPVDTAKTFDPSAPPDLTHTKVLSAKLDGTSLGKGANWNGLLKQAIRLAKQRAKSADDLKRFVIINHVPGKKDDEGYEYLADADLSVQGQDAKGAWRGVAHIAQQLGISVEVIFLWRHKDRAAFPGETGCLAIPPSASR
jgi:hypothetical protein